MRKLRASWESAFGTGWGCGNPGNKRCYGSGGRRIKAEDAYDHIAALTLCNAGTIRASVRQAMFTVAQDQNWDKTGASETWRVLFIEAAPTAGCRRQSPVALDLPLGEGWRR